MERTLEAPGTPPRPGAENSARPALKLIPANNRADAVEVQLHPYDAQSFVSPRVNYALGCVRQNAWYDIQLLFPPDEAPAFFEAVLYVNGSEGIRYSPDIYGYAPHDETSVLKPEKNAPLPFGLVCGCARIKIDLYGYTGNLEASYCTDDIPCEQEHAVDARSAEGMIDALMGDPACDKALEWMTRGGDVADNVPYSLREGGYEKGAARSVPTYLAIVEAGLDSAEAALPYIRGHAAARISHTEDIVDRSKVRRFGAQETCWTAMHPESLRPAVGAGRAIMYRGRPYQPEKVSSARTYRNLNVYENRLCLSFLSTVAANLADFEAKLKDDLDSVNPIRLNETSENAGKILLVVLARTLRNRNRVHIAKADSLRERALRLLRAYQCALPGVDVRPLGEMRLVRTKIFKEVQAYSQLFPSIERFAFYGETILHADGLCIPALRLDRMYETYALYRMLAWLAENGFVPHGENPIVAAKYGYATEVYSDSSHVSNIYRLKRGRTQVTLFYEPVCFSSGKEANGMTLHRMRAGGRGRAEYTPDYVMVVEDTAESGERSRHIFVLDAKYRSRRALTKRYANESTGTEKPSAFEASVDKYLLNTIDSETARIPHAMWLLSGREDEDPEIMPLAALPWEDGRECGFRSGIALLTPNTQLDQLFAEMGIPGLGARSVAEAPEPAEETR